MNASVHPTADGWQIPTGSGRFALLDVCPTPCDDDCDADCHEWHQPFWKRYHRAEQCPPMVAHLTVAMNPTVPTRRSRDNGEG